MPSVREDIAQVRKLINSVSLDTRISNQFIYNKIIDTAKLFIKRDADTRRIYRNIELFKTISCVELESVDLVNCTGLYIPNCNNVMRSKNKLPKAFLTSNGSLLNVYSIDRSVQFLQTTPSIFTNILKREFKGNQKYYWILDDYLYIPNSYISEVIVDGVFIDNSELISKCNRFLDSTSSIPDYLRTDVFRTVANEIGGITLRIPEDESPELNSNKKN